MIKHTVTFQSANKQRLCPPLGNVDRNWSVDIEGESLFDEGRMLNVPPGHFIGTSTKQRCNLKTFATFWIVSKLAKWGRSVYCAWDYSPGCFLQFKYSFCQQVCVLYNVQNSYWGSKVAANGKTDFLFGLVSGFILPFPFGCDLNQLNTGVEQITKVLPSLFINPEQLSFGSVCKYVRTVLSERNVLTLVLFVKNFRPFDRESVRQYLYTVLCEVQIRVTHGWRVENEPKAPKAAFFCPVRKTISLSCMNTQHNSTYSRWYHWLPGVSAESVQPVTGESRSEGCHWLHNQHAAILRRG